MSSHIKELLPYMQIKRRLLSLCVQGQTGNFSLFTEDKHAAVINIHEGEIVGLCYRIANGNEALELIKGIKKARIKFNKSRHNADRENMSKILATVDILRELGIELDSDTLQVIGKKVLVVEDSRTQRKAICRMLTQSGYRVSEASDGYEALEQVDDEKPDLILLDIIMPGIDGYQTMTALKEIDGMQSIPIIMLTSRDKLVDKVRGKISGTNEYLTKPFKSDELIKKVGKYLSVDNKNVWLNTQ